MARIEISNHDLKKAGKVLLAVAALVAVLLIGRAATPVDPGGNLLFLSPHVAEISGYQRQAQRWSVEMSTIDRDMQNLIQDNRLDLFGQDSAYQDINRRAAAVVSEVDSTYAPGSLSGLRDLMAQAAGAHQAAAAALGKWVSEPSAATQTEASSAMAAASADLARIYTNPWVVIQKTAEATHGH